MEISLKKNYGYELIFIDDNIKVIDDIESREYHKGQDGKTDFKLPPKRDIKTEAMEMFTSVLYDMAYYRVAEFDSSNLIEQLYEKLPPEIASDLLEKLNNK